MRQKLGKKWQHGNFVVQGSARSGSVSRIHLLARSLSDNLPKSNLSRFRWTSAWLSCPPDGAMERGATQQRMTWTLKDTMLNNMKVETLNVDGD